MLTSLYFINMDNMHSFTTLISVKVNHIWPHARYDFLFLSLSHSFSVSFIHLPAFFPEQSNS